jgi:hypothetical protein
MVNETKFLLNSIIHWKVGHIKRSGNIAAHKLAKFGLSIIEDHLWRDAYPFYIHEEVYGDIIDFED